MTENEWTKSIAEKLAAEITPLRIETQKKIPYRQEIESFSENWEPNYRKPDFFETDLVIYEHREGIIKPRVIIEAKIDTVTTHDAITYSRKAEMHKNVIPFLRYGIMLGNRKTYPLPGRLYRHGDQFDFMFSFVGTEPEEHEWSAFVEMVQREVRYSETLEEMLHESRKVGRNRYFMLEKGLTNKLNETGN